MSAGGLLATSSQRAGDSRERLLRLSLYALIPLNHLERCRTLFLMFPIACRPPGTGPHFLECKLEARFCRDKPRWLDKLAPQESSLHTSSARLRQ
jgi:hypothetical protein